VLVRSPIPVPGLDPSELFSSEDLALALQARGIASRAFASTDQILDHLARCCRPGDVVAVLSNGGFDNIHTRLLALLSDLNKAK